VADLTITPRDGFGLVSIMARRGVGADRIGAAFGLEAPVAPRRVATGIGVSLIGVGAGHWLALRDTPAPLWADQLRGSLAGLASVSDQSSGYAIVRLGGTGARTILQRGLAIDLHPKAFPVGAAATSVIAQIGVIVWQVDAAPTYDVAVFRSLADSFRHWLGQAAAAL
jgi:methylglutamate dehydrogenase subunit D